MFTVKLPQVLAREPNTGCCLPAPGSDISFLSLVGKGKTVQADHSSRPIVNRSRASRTALAPLRRELSASQGPGDFRSKGPELII